MIIGLTGPTGAGKSMASSVALELGYKVIDCDKLARVAVEKGTDGLKSLVEVFGEDILNPDKTLNRKVLAKKAFVSSDKTELLNKTILPHIVKLVEKEAVGDKILLDAPTLFESGIDSMCDKTLAVLCDVDTRLSRIMERDGIDKENALLRIGAGKPDEFYNKNADYIIYNNGDSAVFCENFKKIICEISGKTN